MKSYNIPKETMDRLLETLSNNMFIYNGEDEDNNDKIIEIKYELEALVKEQDQ